MSSYCTSCSTRPLSVPWNMYSLMSDIRDQPVTLCDYFLSNTRPLVMQIHDTTALFLEVNTRPLVMQIHDNTVLVLEVNTRPLVMQIHDNTALFVEVNPKRWRCILQCSSAIACYFKFEFMQTNNSSDGKEYFQTQVITKLCCDPGH